MQLKFIIDDEHGNTFYLPRRKTPCFSFLILLKMSRNVQIAYVLTTPSFVVVVLTAL